MHRRMWVIVAALGAAACQGASGDAKPPQPDAGIDVGPAGGTITGPGVTLTIPAGALPGTVRVNVTSRPPTSAETASFDVYGDVYTFTPAGTTFAAPVTVHFDAEGVPTDARIFWTAATDDGYEVVERATSAFEGAVSHFSRSFVGKLKSGAIGAIGGWCSSRSEGDEGEPCCLQEHCNAPAKCYFDQTQSANVCAAPCGGAGEACCPDTRKTPDATHADLAVCNEPLTCNGSQRCVTPGTPNADGWWAESAPFCGRVSGVTVSGSSAFGAIAWGCGLRESSPETWVDEVFWEFELSLTLAWTSGTHATLSGTCKDLYHYDDVAHEWLTSPIERACSVSGGDLNTSGSLSVSFTDSKGISRNAYLLRQ